MAMLSKGLTSPLLSDSHQQAAAHQLRVSSTAVAATAAAFVAFAEFGSRAGGKRPPGLGDRLPGSMQLAAAGAALIRELVAHLDSISLVAAYEHSGTRPTHAGLMLAGELRHVLEWLAEPTTPVATASAVLVEALAGLEALVAACPRTRRALAEAGGSFEWAPVAGALHWRLPRRMAARFLPVVDHLSAAVNEGSGADVSEGRDTVSVGETEAAMVLPVKVRIYSAARRVHAHTSKGHPSCGASVCMAEGPSRASQL